MGLACELEQLAPGRFTYEPNRRLAGHLLNHAMHWFWFLIDPTIDATNHWAEQAIRPAVVNRKVWGGNRTWLGARAQSILMSVIRTCEQRALDAFEFLVQALATATAIFPRETVINYFEKSPPLSDAADMIILPRENRLAK